MTNINCSANCTHEDNGKCTLTHISISSNFTGMGADCAYFIPKENNKNGNKKAAVTHM